VLQPNVEPHRSFLGAVFEDIAQKRDAAKAEMPARSERLESYRDVAIAEVQLQADLDLIANDRTRTKIL
jgi:hypothetical protein